MLDLRIIANLHVWYLFTCYLYHPRMWLVTIW